MKELEEILRVRATRGQCGIRNIKVRLTVTPQSSALAISGLTAATITPTLMRQKVTLKREIDTSLTARKQTNMLSHLASFARVSVQFVDVVRTLKDTNQSD